MAIVNDWQKPLEESLESVMNRKSITAEELDRIRNTLDMLDPGTEGAVHLRHHLEECCQKLEKKYQELVQKIDSARNSSETERTVDALKALGPYKDSSEVIARGEQRAEQLRREEAEKEARMKARAKKRRIFAWAAAAALLCVVILIIILSAQAHQEKIKTVKAQIQTMIDTRQEAETGDPLEELASMGIPMEELYPLSEAALESLALREGPDAAYALLEELNGRKVSVVKPTTFNEWVRQQFHAENLSAEQRWAFARAYPNDFNIQSAADDICAVFNEYLLFLAENGEVWDGSKWNAWAEETRPYTDVLPADPETALLLCGRMNDAGADLKSAFPDGILVNVPVAVSVSAANEWFGSENESSVWPSLKKLLPLRVTEKAPEEMYTKTYGSMTKLESGIKEMQAEDDHYSVYLLCGYLSDIPEESRAKTFAECTAYLTMQQSYVLSGYTYTTTTYSNTTYNYFNLDSGLTSNYRGYYIALDAVMLYSPGDAGQFAAYNTSSHEPVIAEEGWYDENKNRSNSTVFTQENTLGVHDRQALGIAYEDSLKNLETLKLLSLILSAGAAEE